MAKIFTISTQELLHPGNNPTGRLDAEGAHALAVLGRKGEPTEPARFTIQALLKKPCAFREWIKALREKTTLVDVETHITQALIGNRNPENLSENVRQGIKTMAARLCAEEKELLEKEVANELRQIAQLGKLAATPACPA